ncbi:GNAT family N-acetyltransferase [Motilibacter peucedani]|nr:GNAT family N-acetyltransferase [Motilibacter peucedani]
MTSDTLATTYAAVRGAVVDPALRDALVDVWVEGVNGGGAVGFLAPVTAADVAPVLEHKLASVLAGDYTLVVLSGPDGPVGLAFLERVYKPHMRHWATVTCVVVTPALQGRGLGRRLMEAVHETARAEGLEALRLAARDGHGLHEFYARLGYVEIGRFPDAIRVAPGDERDELLFWRRL